MVLIMLPTGSATDLSPEPFATSGDEPGSRTIHSTSDFSAEVDTLLQHAAEGDTSQALDDETSAAIPLEAMAAGKSSLLLWSVLAATVLSVTALGTFAWLSSGGDTPSTIPVAVQTIPPDGESSSAGVDERPIADVKEPQASSSATAPTEQLEDLPPDTAQSQQVQKPAITGGEPADDLPAVAPQTPPSTLPETTSELPADNETLAPAPAPSIPPFIDPLGINPADLDLLLVPKAAAAPPEVSPEQPTEEPADHSAILPQSDPLGPPPQKRRFEPGSAELGPSFAEQFPSTTLPTRMAARIPMIRWSNAPLHRVLGEFSQLSGITMQIDPDTLRMALVRANHPVTLSQQDATVDSIVNGLATSLRLKTVPVDDLLVFEKPDVDAVREVSYPIDDLAANEASVAALTELVQRFGIPSTDSSAISTAGGRMVIQQPARYQYDVLLFLERLRKSRGLVSRSKYPPELITVEPLLADLEETLSRSTTFAIVDWTPLVDVIDFWQSSCGVAILVDWRELSRIDRRPFSTLVASVEQLPWGEALDSSLAPLDMAWIPVDNQTIQITSNAAADHYQWVEFYPASRLARLAAKSRTAYGLREALAEVCQPESMAAAVLADDPQGSTILVRANREIHEAILQLRDET